MKIDCWFYFTTIILIQVLNILFNNSSSQLGNYSTTSLRQNRLKSTDCNYVKKKHTNNAWGKSRENSSFLHAVSGIPVALKWLLSTF